VTSEPRRRRDPLDHERPRGNEPRPGEPGYTPNETDFCGCGGGTFQRVRDSRRRRCPSCGAEEKDRQTFHERTDLPYTRGLPPLLEEPEAPADQ
jgi:hypothetical protein